MRDDEHGAGSALPAGLEMFGEPVDGAHVQMVGGLVQHQDVIIPDEQARQVHTAALTTGQLPHQALPGHIRDEAVQDLTDARARGPLVLGKVAHHGPMHRGGAVERIALPEHADRHIAAARHAPRVRRNRPGKHAEQARLAVAVLADDADTVALVDTQGHVLGDQLGGKLQVHAVAAEQNGHNRSSSLLVFTAIHLNSPPR